VNQWMPARAWMSPRRGKGTRRGVRWQGLVVGNNMGVMRSTKMEVYRYNTVVAMGTRNHDPYKRSFHSRSTPSLWHSLPCSSVFVCLPLASFVPALIGGGTRCGAHIVLMVTIVVGRIKTQPKGFIVQGKEKKWDVT
jgi:hypothetical protein